MQWTAVKIDSGNKWSLGLKCPQGHMTDPDWRYLMFNFIVSVLSFCPYRIYEQPELKQPEPSILILEAHIHANPKPKISWLCNGDFVKESDRKYSKLEPRHGEKNKWNATMHILVSHKQNLHTSKLPSNDSWRKNYWGMSIKTYAYTLNEVKNDRP